MFWNKFNIVFFYPVQFKKASGGGKWTQLYLNNNKKCEKSK